MDKIEQIEQCLPQTQCGLCEYAGCRPYAEAITQGERLDKCLPGGVATLRQLGAIMQQPVEQLVPEMQQKSKAPSVAIIREEECIGCTKCVQACPVDAILGASKQMHTVLTDICNGCELCLAPCPVDCIDMKPIAPPSQEQQQALRHMWRRRYQQRNQRLARQKQQKQQQYWAQKLGSTNRQTVAARKQAIQAAIARVKAKKRTG